MGYGFKSGAGGGADGAKLTVNAPAGSTVTVSKDGKTKTRVADSSGVAVFKGLSTGDWTVTITDGSKTATKTVTVTADYATTITFFKATINVTYPAGSVCKVTNRQNPKTGALINAAGTVIGTLNGRTYTKTYDGEAIYAFAYVRDGDFSGPMLVSTTNEAITYTWDGNVTGGTPFTYNGKTYYYSSGAWFSGNILPPGKPCLTEETFVSAATALAKSYEDYLAEKESYVPIEFTAPDTSGTWDCVVPNAGAWNIECVVGSTTLSESVMIDTSGQTKNAELKYYIFKDGVFPGGIGTYADQSYAATRVAIENNNLYVEHHGYGQLVIFGNYTFDVTGFNKLVFIIDRSYCTNEGDNGTTYYGVGSVAQSFDFNASAAVYTADAYNYPVTVDISQINGLQYVKLNNVRNAYFVDILCISQIYLA